MGYYLDNVDFEQLYSQAVEKALKQFIYKSVEQFADTGVKLEPGDWPFHQWVKYWCDYYWLMGPVPMKHGYVPPKFEMSDELMNQLYPNGFPKIEPIYDDNDPDRPGYQESVLEKLNNKK